MATDRWQRVDELFHAALDRPASERRAFLEAACGGDASLYSEVQSLVQADSSADNRTYDQWAGHAAAAWAGDVDRGAAAGVSGAGRPAVAGLTGQLVGRSVSHYTIRASLGAGGMGEVYLARDETLSRDVALKVLPPEVAGDADRLARFVLEARAASALSHPNVAAIHELAEHDGFHFIVMEYVEGRSLEAVLHEGPMPIDRALGIAADIGRALEDAHRLGITHRDIKPANVMLSVRGEVKVLDFGLAKMRHADEAGVSRSAFLTTIPGLVMGTVHYMSPEQALGEKVDHRSDLFSLGIVLYELLAGRLPFKAPSATATIDAIVHREPTAVTAIRVGIPRAVDRVLARALAKRPEDRYQQARALVDDLESLRRREAPRGAPRRWVRRGRLRPGLVIAAALLTALAGVGLASVWTGGRATAPTVLPFTSFAGTESTPAFAPDGETLAYSWDGPDEDNVDIYLQAIGGSPVRLTSDAAPDTNPAFSPDGTLVAFVRGRRLLVVPRGGGAERGIGTVTDPRITFTPDGRAIAAGGPAGLGGGGAGISLYPLDGSAPRPLTAPPAGIVDISPAFSPDGTRLAFQRIPTTAVSDVWVADARGDGARRLTFDDRSLEGPVWTADGRSLVFSSARVGAGRLWRVPAEGGTPEPIRDTGPGSTYPAIARRGDRLAFIDSLEDTNIWELPLDANGAAGGPPRRTASASTWLDGSPDFSRDGAALTFSSNRSGRDEVWVAPAGAVSARQVTAFTGVPATAIGSPRWSPDGTRIVFDARVRGNADVYLVAASGGAPERLTEDPSADVVPAWSRDGAWIYFTSRRTGRPELWRRPAAGGPETQVTDAGGFGAQESLDGAFVIYGKDRVNSPLWRRPIGGGPETPVLVDDTGVAHTVAQFAFWRPTRRGIIFLQAIPGRDRTAPTRHLLQAIDLTTRRVTTLFTLTGRPSMAAGGIAVSPDERRVLFTQVDEKRSDVRLLQPFR
jgi:Tol biopolymer transport system component/predicted Ser/Thr protein kinase